MKLRQIKILADENLSPRVVAFLRQEGINVRDTKEEQWHGKADEELLQIAYREERFVLTHDADFGALAVNQGKPCSGMAASRSISRRRSDRRTRRGRSSRSAALNILA